MKDHILNDIIWPNRSDESGGAGLLDSWFSRDNTTRSGERDLEDDSDEDSWVSGCKTPALRRS